MSRHVRACKSKGVDDQLAKARCVAAVVVVVYPKLSFILLLICCCCTSFCLALLLQFFSLFATVVSCCL
jgi:hypothetical protein